MIHDKSFECSLPSSKAWRLSFKNDIISLSPKARGTNHKDFHEERHQSCSNALPISKSSFFDKNSMPETSKETSSTQGRENEANRPKHQARDPGRN
jgi:hypothetical protein